jgi:hypothetical protein
MIRAGAAAAAPRQLAAAAPGEWASRALSNYSASTSAPSASRVATRGYIKKGGPVGGASAAPSSPILFPAQRPSKPSTAAPAPPAPDGDNAAEIGSPAPSSAPPDASLERPEYAPPPRVRKPPIFNDEDAFIDAYDSMEVQATGRDVPEPLQSFNQLGPLVSKRLLRNMAQLKLQKPTPVQRQVIPVMLAGRDLMACSHTGTGKTAAYLVPVLARLLKTPRCALLCETAAGRQQAGWPAGGRRPAAEPPAWQRPRPRRQRSVAHLVPPPAAAGRRAAMALCAEPSGTPATHSAVRAAPRPAADHPSAAPTKYQHCHPTTPCRASTKNRAYPRAVVLAPTRELAQQIWEDACRWAGGRRPAWL